MFSDNKIQLSKVLQQNMTEVIQQFPMLSSIMKITVFFGCVNCISN